MRSTASRARTASITSGVVTGSPEARSTPPNFSMARVRSRGAGMVLALGGHEPSDAAGGELPLEALHVVGVLDHAAQRLRYQILVEMIGVPRRKRLPPV